MRRCRAKIIIDECKLAKLLKLHPLYKANDLIGRCSAAYSFGKRHQLDHFDKTALSKEICFFSGGGGLGPGSPVPHRPHG